MLAVGLGVACRSSRRRSEGQVWALVVTALLAVAMGLQAATARRLAVKDVTTVVVTSTLTGLAADSRLAGGTGRRVGAPLARGRADPGRRGRRARCCCRPAASAASGVGMLVAGVLALVARGLGHRHREA